MLTIDIDLTCCYYTEIDTMKNNPHPLKKQKFILTKPNFDTVDESKITQIFRDYTEKYRKIVNSANQPQYIYWDKFQHKAKDEELSITEQWLLVKIIRDTISIDTPIKSENGKNFRWVKLSIIDEYLHKIDMLMGGKIFPSSKLPIENKESFINRGIIEEAIASSQLEGAHTTRVAAKKFISEKRTPQNESEQMILNNYKAMLALEENFKSRLLSKKFLFELHSILTNKTVKKSEQKRFRRDSDEIVIQGLIGSEVYTAHIPPNEKFLDSEIERLILYANDQLENRFTHPIIKAIFIHFWIGYLHPFTDGNGRIARSLFYWYLLKNDYWAFSYIPISTVIKKSPAQYAMAYIYTEQDSNDLTYFFDYQIKKIDQAITEFENYFEKKLKQNKNIDKILDSKVNLNERQKQLLHYFISDKNGSTTSTTHSEINTISRQTAAKDLKKLEKIGLVKSYREGKFTKYQATKKLIEMSKKNG